jgi:hypothetical protein
MYNGGCIFVDHASGYIFTHYHVHQGLFWTTAGKDYNPMFDLIKRVHLMCMRKIFKIKNY